MVFTKWEVEFSNNLLLKDGRTNGVLSLAKEADGQVTFREECDGFYSVTMPVEEARKALLEALAWINDGKAEHSTSVAKCNTPVEGLAYADESQGHLGGVYRAAGWEYVGRTGPYQRWLDTSGRQVAPKATKNRTKAEMETLGHTNTGVFHKHKYVLRLPARHAPGCLGGDIT